ncbi:branched-chain-amino-acid aminotransferase 2, chloroplastic-like [Solanum dulcamara]|uniref:branched-chain-amino-acid aminotransferase 2, chloroplastic-like n=1 Tax=Solanum dulcamara TaxID=45834 RepID=UPI002485583B|nr:branched-chain-amino-acid aminotransferase 2, chloroplastic-like [Solanum dulcamara]
MIQRAAFFRKLIGSSSLPSKFGARYSTAQAATSIQAIEQSDDESIDIDWENLGFNLIPTDYMYQTKSCENGHFKQGQLNPYGNIQLSPSAGVLNYGQGIFEGTKAYRRDDGRLFLFRPQQNAMRMQIGAERMCMPCPSIDQFVDAVKQTALANKRFEGTSSLNLYVEEDFHRASRGGVGGVKSITNYAPVLRAVKSAKEKGFSDVLYLDSINKRYIEEVSSCNIFLVKGKIISTPATSGTILEGVTRKSIMDIAHDLGYQVEERLIEVEELNNADEVFCTGTAVGIASVGSITYKGKRIEYKEKLTSKKLYSRLIGIQRGVIEDRRDWIVEI